MLKLYGGAFSRASLVRWYLEEIQAPYEFVLLDMKAGEHLEENFRAINPFKKVPAIVDGDLKLWESGAILLYLAEKYGELPAELEKRAVYYQWVLFGNSTLATGLFVEASREKEAPRLLTELDKILADNPYILGKEFSVVDVAVGSILCYVPMMLKLDLTPYPHVLSYIARMSDREAFKKTIGNRG